MTGQPYTWTDEYGDRLAVRPTGHFLPAKVTASTGDDHEEEYVTVDLPAAPADALALTTATGTACGLVDLTETLRDLVTANDSATGDGAALALGSALSRGLVVLAVAEEQQP